MSIENRTVAIKGVFGKNANTTIPDPPSSGASYRDESVTQQEIEKGWGYKEIVDSAKFNEALFEYANTTALIEKYGFLPWCNLTDYPAGALCLGSNGTIYQAAQDTGPSTTAFDPVNDTNHTYWNDFVGSTYVTRTTSQQITGNKSFAATATFTGHVNLNGSLSSTSRSVKKTVIGWGLPNYNAGISFTSTLNYTTPSEGWVVFDSHKGTKFYEITVYVDEQAVFWGHTGDYAKYPIIFPVSAGQMVRISDGTFRGTFYPMKGL